MGKININIQREDRLAAINNLSKAIYEVAKALSTPIEVLVSGCTINNSDVAISIQKLDEVDTETIEIEQEELLK
jgi:hypothetical protein